MEKLTSLILFFFLAKITVAQHAHFVSKDVYTPPQDSLVMENLEKWQDLKFGLMMHWGLYAQLGIVESWALCSEDQSFQDRKGIPYQEFKDNYNDQIRHFNPKNFDPKPWAKAAKAAGMKYLVFTTKHHDGFSMWDTKQTDFKITSKRSPFHNHKNADVLKALTDEFRSEGFMIGTYFSKADWNHPDYWSPLWATPNRNNNYDTKKYPEKWQSFRDFSYNQIEELMTGYGDIDILWLDGGWVRPDSTINAEVKSWGYDIPKWEQDIDMPRIAKMARKHQPNLIITDRTVHGPYENYRTPEQRIPDEVPPYPWETCMTMSGAWGYIPGSVYKSPETIIHNLINIVVKGGNYLLNIGPKPDGTWEEQAYKNLKEIGAWMDINGDAIYGTRTWSNPQQSEHILMNVAKDKSHINIFFTEFPNGSVALLDVPVKKGSQIKMYGSEMNIPYEMTSNGILLKPDENLKNICNFAWVFKVEIE